MAGKPAPAPRAPPRELDGCHELSIGELHMQWRVLFRPARGSHLDVQARPPWGAHTWMCKHVLRGVLTPGCASTSSPWGARVRGAACAWSLFWAPLHPRYSISVDMGTVLLLEVWEIGSRGGLVPIVLNLPSPATLPPRAHAVTLPVTPAFP
eukprot:352197-Chlamydomonas_euryale.AAC.3